MAFSLLIDEDAMARALVRGLWRRDVNVQTVHEAGLVGHTDETVLAYAAEIGRTLYTFNVGDFCRLHAAYMVAHRSHAGVIVVPRQRYTVGEQLRGIMKLHHAHTSATMRNRLVFMRV